MSHSYQPLGNTEDPTVPEDPFYSLRSRCLHLASELQDHMQSMADHGQYVRNDSAGYSSALSTLKTNLKTLDKMIRAIEKNRNRFKHVDDHELSQRKLFRNDIASTVQDATSTRAQFTSRMEKTSREELFKSPVTNQPINHHRIQQSNASRRFVDSKQAQHADLQSAQDEVLDDMAGALERLGGVAEGMNSELKTHTIAIDSLDENMTSAEARFDLVMGKLDNLLGKSDKGRYACILLLGVIAVLEMIFIVY